MSHEVIRVWKHGPYRLALIDQNKYVHGLRRLSYVFRLDGKVIFRGDDFGPSPMHADDSDESVAGLLCFLSLRPGDTDREYFDSYTKRQMEFASEHGEELGYIANRIEERAARRNKSRR
jgi:hypothetical protein